MNKKLKSKKTNPYKKHIETLSKVSEAITSGLYLEDILKLIVTVTAEVMNSKICSLMLLDDDTKTLSVKATQSVSDLYNRKPDIKLGEGIAGKVALTGEPMIVPNVQESPEYSNREIAKEEGLRSLLSIPLKVKEKIIGVLNIYTAKLHTFSKSEIEVLTAVANQASIVIENSRLIIKTKVIQEELESRKLVERAKGILMKDQGLSEDEAFKKIQKTAMNLRRQMKDIAEAIVLAHSTK